MKNQIIKAEIFFLPKNITQIIKICTYTFLFACFLNFTSSVSFGQPQTLDRNFEPSLEKIGGSVTTIVTQPDGKILLGGYFRFVDGGKRINIARLNSDRTVDTTFTIGKGANRDVTSLVVQPDGKILVGGYFTKFNGINAGGIVRLNADGSVDTSFDSTGVNIGTNTGFGILALSLQPDGKILLGGNFPNYSGATVKNFIRINSDGSRDTTFNPSSVVINGIVNTVNLASDNKIYISTNFSNQNGDMSQLIRFNTNGSQDTGFASSVRNAETKSVAIQADGKILVGGSSPQGTFTISLIRYNQNGTIDAGFNTTSNSFVNTIIPEADGSIIIAGDFELWNDQPQVRFAKLNSDGTLNQSFATNPGVNFSVRTAAKLNDGKYLLGGLDIQPQTIDNPLSLQQTDGNADSSFLTKIKINSNSQVIAVQPNRKILIAGEFTFVNGISRNGIARLNQNGSLDTSFMVVVDKSIETIAVQPDGKILLGGKFDTVNGVAQKGITRLTTSGEIDSTFIVGTGVGGSFFPVPFVSNIIVLDSGKILAGGTFAFYNGTSRKGIVRINPDGSVDESFDPGAGITGGSEIVYSIIQQPDGKILVGGNFNSINGQTRVGIGRLNANGSLDTGFGNVGLSNSVHSVSLQPDGKILIGGIFDSINGNEFKHLARLNSNGSVDNTFSIGSGFSGGTGFSFVEKIAQQPNGKILVGGNFTFYNSLASNYLIRLNSNGSKDETFAIGTGADGRVNSLISQSDGNILFGGLFSEFDGLFRTGIARLSTNRQSPRFDFDGDGKTDIGIFRPAPGEWWYLRSSDNANRAFQFGQGSDKIVPADFTGDGKTDIAFWRESTGEWFVLRSEDNSFFAFPFGTSGDIPAPGDFDGDGKADAAVFRPSSATWYINNSGGGQTIQQFGANGDIPIPQDFDGDGKDDIAVFRPNFLQWYYQKSSNQQVTAFQFGNAGDRAIPADYTGDGKTDIAFWRPSGGVWYILRSEDSSFYGFPFGISGDIPVPGDYDGDGKADAAVFRPTNNTWFLQQSTNGSAAVSFGINGDVPLPSVYNP